MSFIQEENFVNTKQVAQYLGVTKATVFNLAKQGIIPNGYKLGRNLRWKLSEIEKALIQRRV